MTGAKACSRCGEIKPLTEYGNHAKSKDGLQQQCKPCRAASRAISDAAYRERNRERLREYHAAKEREYRAANPERYREKGRRHYRKDVDKSRERSRESEKRRRERVPDEVRAIQKRARLRAVESANASKVRHGLSWEGWEDELVADETLTAIEVATRIGRGLSAVASRRRRLRDVEGVKDELRQQERRDLDKTLPRAANWGKVWTGPELEVVADYRLSAVEAALLLGRTSNAVENQRGHLNRKDPKKTFLAGLPIATTGRLDI